MVSAYFPLEAGASSEFLPLSVGNYPFRYDSCLWALELETEEEKEEVPPTIQSASIHKAIQFPEAM